MLKGVLADVLARPVPDHQQLDGRHASAPRSGQQHLGHDGGERHRQLLPDGRLAFGRECVGHTRDGGRDVARVHRREDQVPDLSGGERDAHGLRVAHLAHHNHVGRLAHRRPQGRGKVRRIDPDLHLLDHAPLVRVVVLNRIFDGDDVLGISAVDQVDQRGNRRRLS
jgi:hypothetical protein